MRALAESALHASSKADAGFAEFIPQAVGGGQSLVPALLATGSQQIDLALTFFKTRSVHPKQAHFGALVPVLPEKRAYLLEYFRVELRRCCERMRARNGSKVFVAQL